MSMMNDIYPHLKSLWTVWFFLLFVGIIVWAMWPGQRAKWDERAQIPLRDGADKE